MSTPINPDDGLIANLDKITAEQGELYRCPECHEWTDTIDPCCGVGPTDEDAIYEAMKERK